LKNPSEILKHYWGFNTFKPKQLEIIQAVLEGKDSVALLPTGGGKSMCFQIPAIALNGLCIVITPLVALMNDQVTKLKERGIKALAISGGISYQDLDALLDNCVYGNYTFLYISPERLQQDIVKQRLQIMPVKMIAVDEAHCISQWGNDFRPAYKNISFIRDYHPNAPIIALTATANTVVLNDTIQELNLNNPIVFKQSFKRENLAYKTLKTEDKLYRIQQLVNPVNDCCIIYVRNRRATVETSLHLNKLGYSTTFYHGGLTNIEKTNRLQEWLNNRVKIMVSTNAFGMGIDKPDVRFVFHIQLPESVESYFQEAGRAGRNNKKASSIILYNEGDIDFLKKQHIETLPRITFLKKLYRALNNYFQISYGEGEFTSHSFNFNDFCKTYSYNPILAHNGLQSLDRLGILKLSKEFGRKSSMQFIISSNKLLSYFEKDLKLSLIGKTILRIYGGIFEKQTFINLNLIANKTGQTTKIIIEALKKMEGDGITVLNLIDTDASITIIMPREDNKTINRFSKVIEAYCDLKEKQVLALIAYVQNDTICKSVQLLSYFDEDASEDCGICSVCLQQQLKTTKIEHKTVSKKIIELLEVSALTSRELLEKLTFDESKVLVALKTLLAEEFIAINSKNQYYKL